MAIRQTSIDCFNKINAQGLLSKRRFQTYKALIEIAPCTASELQKSMNYNDGGRDCMKRLSELRNLGVIYEKKERKCKITGRNVIEWDLTDKLPLNVKASDNTKKQRVQTALDYLNELYKKKTTSSFDDWRKLSELIKKI
jgi:hypothetical protein